MDVLVAVAFGLVVYGLVMVVLLGLDCLRQQSDRRRAAGLQDNRIRAERQLADEAFRVQRDMVRHATDSLRRR